MEHINDIDNIFRISKKIINKEVEKRNKDFGLDMNIDEN